MDELIDDGDWELVEDDWGLGDKAYIAINHFFLWGRIEVVIAKLKKHAWCKTAFRGRWKSLVAPARTCNLISCNVN